MNTFSFIHLIMMIFGKKLPDLKRIQKKGLLAVKIAQTFALRIDFLSEEKCRHLAQLYSHTIPLPYEGIEQLLGSYTDETWRSHFAFIDPKPLGSASVGQVHRAKLKTGEDVVVKIIKKDFTKSFVRDANRLERFMKFLIFFYPILKKVADPVGIIRSIKEFTLAELDLRNEVKHSKVLRDIYLKNREKFNLTHLNFPKIYEKLSSEKVMVSEFIDGPTVDELLEKKALPYKDLLEIFHIHGFYMYVNGTFHGDLHPGNIIKKGEQYYFIDTGAISHVGDKIRLGLFYFMANLSKGDYDGCARSLNEMADVEISGEKFERFKVKLLNLYKDFTGKTVSEVSLTQKMMETIQLGVRSGMVFEQGMYPIIKSHMYLDGMVIKGNPSAVLMRDVGSFVDEFKKDVLAHGQ